MGAASTSTRAWAQAQAQGPLRLSLPPLADGIPLAFALEQGLFRAQGLDVEIIGISSRRTRNAALFSGGLDGVISDITSALFGLSNAGAQIAITSTAFEPVDGTRALALLASGSHHIESLDQLLGRLDEQAANSIMLWRRTDMEYATDRLFQALGIPVDPDVFYADADDLVDVATLLVAGSVLAAVLPEPLASITEKNDLIEEPFRSVEVSDFSEVALPPSVVVFRRQLLEARPDDIRTFYDVYRQAIEQVNASGKDVILEVGIDKGLELFLPGLKREELPEDFGDFVTIPLYPQPRPLAPEEFTAVADWAAGKGYLNRPVLYEQAVDLSFLTA